MKILLLATLSVASGIGLMLGQEWRDTRESVPERITANVVGVYASVPGNPTNDLAAQLEARRQELDAREAALTTRGTVDTRTLTVVTILGASLLGLILTNFYLDNRRRHSLA